jgi:hypothetical protein
MMELVDDPVDPAYNKKIWMAKRTEVSIMHKMVDGVKQWREPS